MNSRGDERFFYIIKLKPVFFIFFFQTEYGKKFFQNSLKKIDWNLGLNKARNKEKINEKG